MYCGKAFFRYGETMSSYYLEGGNKIYGEVKISPAKNSVLALACASVIIDDEIFLTDCPDIGDVRVLSEVLEESGVTVRRNADGLYMDGRSVFTPEISKNSGSKIRASFFLTGALLSKFGYAVMPLPGGCKLGARPVDIHIDGLVKMGAKVKTYEDRIVFYAGKLKGAKINLRYPSVGATENLILAAVKAEGETVIKGSAKEPEVKDLCDFLNLCGAEISGGGTDEIVIRGVKRLHGKISYRAVPDRIEAGTFLTLCYLLGGKVLISGVNSQNICSLTEKILDNTCNNGALYVNIYSDKIYIQSDGKSRGFGNLKTGPYPAFPTDLHPIIACAAAGLDGETIISETVFSSRFGYLEQLRKLGAEFAVENDKVTVFGGKLKGAKTTAPDLRGGAGLVVASLVAEGKSVVEKAEVIMRGYERFDKKLSAIGAKIKLRES